MKATTTDSGKRCGADGAWRDPARRYKAEDMLGDPGNNAARLETASMGDAL